jgi:hypothetical protein
MSIAATTSWAFKMLDKNILWTFVAVEMILTLALMAALIARLPLLPVIVPFVVLSSINSLVFVMRVRAARSKQRVAGFGTSFRMTAY